MGEGGVWGGQRASAFEMVLPPTGCARAEPSHFGRQELAPARSNEIRSEHKNTTTKIT